MKPPQLNLIKIIKDFISMFKYYLVVGIHLILSSSLMAQHMPSGWDNPQWTYRTLNESAEEWTTVFSVKPNQVNICGEIWWEVVGTSFRYDPANSFTLGYYHQAGSKYFYRSSTDCSKRKYLMFDFSAEVGDTLHVGVPIGSYLEFPDLDSIPAYVLAIDSVLYGPTLRKRIITSVGAWIEGVGSLRFPLPPAYCPPGAFTCETIYVIECLTTNAGVIYTDSDAEDSICSYPLGTPKKIFVDQNKTSASISDGSSWNKALLTIQQALSIAEIGDTIWVAKGTYYPTEDTDRTAAFTLKQGVKIFGGFAGIERLLSERLLDTNFTILSGDIGERFERSDNSYHVVYGLGIDSTTVLDGFVIKEGYAIHPNSNYFGSLIKGGGLLIDTDQNNPMANPIIRNCSFQNNTARFGGAVSLNGNESRAAMAKFQDCEFYSNFGNDMGGAIYKLGTNASIKQLSFHKCKFYHNKTRLGGASLAIVDADGDYLLDQCEITNDTSLLLGGGSIDFSTFETEGSFVLRRCTFEGNQGEVGGAVSFKYLSQMERTGKPYDLIIEGTTFLENRARVDLGGPIDCILYTDSINMVIKESEFIRNSSAQTGGAISATTHDKCVLNTILESCKFAHNSSSFVAGGALFFKGGETNANPKKITLKIDNSSFWANTGGLLMESGKSGDASALLNNCSFYKNGAFPLVKSRTSPGQDLGFTAEISLTNSIIWEPSLSIGDIFVNGDSQLEELYGFSIDHCLLSAVNCNIAGGEQACKEGLIFSTDPIFIDPENGDLSLASCSPAINQGIVTDFLDLPLLDLAGNSRVQEDTVDLGSYEREKYNIQIERNIVPTCYEEIDGEIIFNLNGDSPYLVSWLKDDGDLGIGSSMLGAGEYNFKVEDHLGCTENISIQVSSPSPITPFYTTIGASSNDNVGAILLDSIQGGPPPFRFLWNTTSEDSSIFYLQPGSYDLSITDQNDCQIDTTFTVPLVDQLEDRIISDEDWQVRPNPISKESGYNILAPNLKLQWVFLYDSIGRMIKKEKYHQGLYKASALSPGMYLVKIVDDENAIGTKKVIFY